MLLKVVLQTLMRKKKAPSESCHLPMRIICSWVRIVRHLEYERKSDSISALTDPDAVDWFRESLPLELNVVKGAIVMGNRSTPSLVVAGFHSAVGTCGAVKVGVH
jgi:hypothetical protein